MNNDFLKYRFDGISFKRLLLYLFLYEIIFHINNNDGFFAE
jgi:hypothetical protein